MVEIIENKTKSHLILMFVWLTLARNAKHSDLSKLICEKVRSFRVAVSSSSFFFFFFWSVSPCIVEMVVINDNDYDICHCRELLHDTLFFCIPLMWFLLSDTYLEAHLLFCHHHLDCFMFSMRQYIILTRTLPTLTSNSNRISARK